VSPAYTAVIEWLPAARLLVVSVATNDAFSAPVPSDVVPSMNVTVPVGVPAGVGVTVAVKVTDWPTFAGFAEDTTAVDVPFTVCVNAADVLGRVLGPPLYTAVIEWLPAVSVEIANVAEGPGIVACSGAVPSVVEPSLNVTVVPPSPSVTIAVNLTDCPNGLGFRDEVSVVELAAGFTVCDSAVEVLVENVASPP